MENKFTILEKYFGYSSFREGQELLIDELLLGQDVLGIMPTGAGKSLCFQVPAMLLEGITLVVSPLISLMKDQVNALTQAGISAAFINSSLTPKQSMIALDNARTGMYKIIYIAPERLLTEEFINFCHAMTISMICVDEAHCVSQWGQDFRPSYLKILEFIGQLAVRPIVSAFTATATAMVCEDIIQMLNLSHPTVISTGFDRKNLYFEVQKPRDKFVAVQDFLKTNPDKSGIIYCSTRKAVEEVCARLNACNYDTTRYHAGLGVVERRENQDDFLYDRKQIMVATNAFGMGIDKSNVSFVIHYNMPKNVESYYQEAGRAGRDGQDAHCILLYGGQDVITNQFLIDNGSGNEQMDSKTTQLVKEQERARLKTMTFYCHTHDCLRQYMLRYFGEQSGQFCGNCSNCNSNFELEDITVSAQKILSCVKRAGERFGVNMIIQILRGSKTDRLLQFGLDQLTTYGIMKSTPEKQLREMINFLILQNYLIVTDDQFPLLKLTRQANDVLFHGEKLQMKITEVRPEAKPKRTLPTAKHPELFAKLKQIRNEIATQQHVPSYIVFNDATLLDMCDKLPETDEAFLDISGVGQVKLQRYGDAFLSAIRMFLEETQDSVLRF